ncbi:hypothetical protein SAMN05216413_2642 [Ruminococcaceae bacterium KH2T8]|nr:hypothetical protein SAMN05216413_2642 [Ruminococcaceae bacterium KH2T8]
MRGYANPGRKESEEILYGRLQAREWTINTGRTKQQTTTETYTWMAAVCVITSSRLSIFRRQTWLTIMQTT